VILKIIAKPKRSGTSMPDDAYTDYYDTILNGAIARLLRVPGKDWSNRAASADYYAMFMDGVYEAKRRARQSDSGAVPIVGYGGIGSYGKTLKNNYGSES